jgi:hypothetical protein
MKRPVLKMRRLILLQQFLIAVLLLGATATTLAFTPSVRPNVPATLNMVVREPEAQTMNRIDATFDDNSSVDARVLQAMIAEQQVDLSTAADVWKLLQRSVSNTASSSSSAKPETLQQNDDNAFRSKLLQTVTDSAVWTQVQNAWESLQLRINNKVQADLQVLAALGVLVVDRVQSDVARALPSSRTPFLLASNSSATSSSSTLRQALARPTDELAQVAQQVRDIFDSQTIPGSAVGSTTSRRSLRTTSTASLHHRSARAAAATMSSTSKQPLQLLDTAWELQSELQSEQAAVAGYKTAPVRRALQASVAETRQVLQAALQQEQVRRQQRVLTSKSSIAEEATMPTNSVDNAAAVSEAMPASSVDVLENAADTAAIQEDIAPSSTPWFVATDSVSESTTADATPWFAAATDVANEFEFVDEELEELWDQDEYNDVTTVLLQDEYSDEDVLVVTPVVENTVTEATILDVVNEWSADVETAALVEEPTSSSYEVEVVSDDDFDQAFEKTTRDDDVTAGTTSALASAAVPEDSAAVQLLLRSFDIAFFLAEKTATTAVPVVVETSTTAASRILSLGDDGRGQRGWKKLRRSNPGSRRY